MNQSPCFVTLSAGESSTAFIVFSLAYPGAFSGFVVHISAESVLFFHLRFWVFNHQFCVWSWVTLAATVRVLFPVYFISEQGVTAELLWSESFFFSDPYSVSFSVVCPERGASRLCYRRCLFYYTDDSFFPPLALMGSSFFVLCFFFLFGICQVANPLVSLTAVISAGS